MGGRFTMWSAWAHRTGIYQHQFQVAILLGVDLPLDLSEFSEQESISTNFNSPFYGGRSASWSAWALRTGIYQYQFQIAILQGGRSATWSAWAHWVGIYQCQFQIAILLGVDLPLDLPELSEQESISTNFKSPFYKGVDLPLDLPELTE